ncbi:MAG TPA: XRE family transcriptional regulator [Candidatus Acidoferrales bacterium]|nr:XRE family transcriptional regulator [Candidatus Acidoferrales bacterium]
MLPLKHRPGQLYRLFNGTTRTRLCQLRFSVPPTAELRGSLYSFCIAGSEHASSHPASGSVDSIGQQLRLLRGARGRGVRELARQVGVTASLLSQIERGTARPSVDTLFRLAQALNASTDSFFGMDHRGRPEASPVLEPSARSRIELAQGIVWERLTPGEEEGLEFLEVTFPSGAVSSPMPHQHPGRDYLLVTDGILTLELEGRARRLKLGDSIAFDASLPHRLMNEGKAAARAVSVIVDRGGIGTPADSGPHGESAAPTRTTPGSSP